VLIPSVGASFSNHFTTLRRAFEILEARPARITIKTMIAHPQTLARTHQSGRFSIISYRRSSAQAGIHLTPWILEGFLAQGFLFSVSGLVHFDEPLLGARKITGLWQRQQCG